MATKKINWEKMVKPPTRWERFTIWFYWTIGRNLVDIIFYTAMIVVLTVCVYEFATGLIDYQNASDACVARGGLYANSLCLDPKALR